MHPLLDASVQLIQVALLLALVAQNFTISRRLRNLEEKLGSKS